MTPIGPRPLNRLALFASLLLPLAPRVEAQEVVCRPWLDGPRIGTATAETGLRGGTEALTDGCNSTGREGIAALPVTGLGRFRSAYPYDHLDGALWSGRGLSASISGGARLAAGPVRITVDPTLTWSQNRAFATAGKDLRDPYEPIDWPQRPREGAFAHVAWGQSAIALEGGPAEISLGAENVWWGPARRYPILLGSSAPGFAHLRIGTREPVDVGIGTLDLDLLWGRLDESPQFDTVVGNDHRLLSGFFVQLRPRGLDGLSLGVAGVQHNRWTDARSKWLNLFTFPFAEEEHTEGNGLVSFTASWRLEEADADFYAEWARDDYWVDVDALLTEPDRSQAYLLGVEKRLGGPENPWRLSWELVHLGSAGDILTRGFEGGVLGFYSHAPETQGHTHQGQMLGAAIGPSSNATFLSVERLGTRRTLGGYVERIRRDDGAYYVLFAPTYQFTGYDIELTAALTGEERRGSLRIEWEGVVSRRRNRSFRGMEAPDNPYPWHFPVEWDLGFTTRVVWVP